MDHLCGATGKPLAHPYSCQAAGDSISLEPFVETFADFGEVPAIWIIADFGPDPMNGRMSIQGSADLTCERHRRHHVGGLPH